MESFNYIARTCQAWDRKFERYMSTLFHFPGGRTFYNKPDRNPKWPSVITLTGTCDTWDLEFEPLKPKLFHFSGSKTFGANLADILHGLFYQIYS